MSANFNGKKDLIGMLFLSFGLPIMAVTISSLTLLFFMRGGKLIIALLILMAVFLVYLYKLRKNKKQPQ
ncbi:MAG: FeoB-associated Cys-rich membrane protein [Phycisphaerae bacterium]|jgi:apolipoprotein N-acyltransferase